MASLTFECPRTRCTIDAGIQMDQDTLDAAGPTTVKVCCPHCYATHELPIQCGRLSEVGIAGAFNECEQPKIPALSIAINTLRIHLLQRGLAAGPRHSSN